MATRSRLCRLRLPMPEDLAERLEAMPAWSVPVLRTTGHDRGSGVMG